MAVHINLWCNPIRGENKCNVICQHISYCGLVEMESLKQTKIYCFKRVQSEYR